jgi:hypothetical protein
MATPEQFAAELLKGAAAATAVTTAVVAKGALNIKNDARANVKRTAPVHSGGAENTINYDVEASGASIVAEIGYDRSMRIGKGYPGKLGNLLEYGGGGDHSPPHRDLGRALDDEEPKFEAALNAAIGKLL